MLKKFRSRFNRLFLVCASLALMAGSAFPQSQATTGNIEGRVLDPNGAAVPGVTVTATNQQTGFEKTATSDDEGNYRLILLPPGAYRIVATGAAGFQPATLENAAVSVGGQTSLDITLGVGGATTIIDVSAESPVVETTRTSVATTVNERDIENLPVSGRNYLDFATLTPGVVRDPSRQGDLSVGGQKGTLNSLQVDGADNNNTFFGQAFGRTGVRPPYQFSEESVKEFQVNQNGFSAEFGRAGGAVINVVTKSGTNDFHGGGFEYFRDESLNANAPNIKGQQGAEFDLGRRLNRNKRAPQQINQFGFRLGGPIVKNRAFFFGTYDGQRQDLPNIVEPANLATQTAAIRDLLSPRLAPYQISRNQDVYLLKTDIAVNASNQLSLRFNRQNFTGVNNEFTGALASEEHSGDSIARTTTFSGTLASTITPSVVNEFRFQFARDAEPGTANSDLPETQINTQGNGFLLLGRNNFSPRETTIRRAQFINNLSYVRGQHNYKVGVDLNFDRILNFFPGFFSGQYTFNSYADFASNANCASLRTPGGQSLPNCPSGFQQRFALPNTSGATSNPNSSDYAVFLQDDWRATRRLTLNLGVRYDYQNLAAPPLQNPNASLLAAGLDTSRQPSDGNNIAPRLGFAYDVGGNGKTVVRGGYGIFYGRTTAIMLGTAHTGNGVQTTGVNFANTAQIAAAGLVYPNVVMTAPTAVSGTPDIFLFAEDYAQPYVQQARLGFEHEVLENMSVSVTYLFFRGVHLSRTRDINLRAPELATAIGAGQTFTVERFPGVPNPAANPPVTAFTSTVLDRPLSRFGRINLFESTANSRYDGLAFQVQRRFSRGFQFLASYTYSKAKDDKPDQTAVVPGGGDDAKIVQNQLNIRADYAAADSDLRHRFVFSPVYEFGRFTASDNRVLGALLSGYTLSSIVQLQSGFAFSQTVGADLNRDGNARNDRVPGTPRNGFYTPATYQFDARLTRTIPFGESMRLRLILEGFNILNRANVATVNTNFFAGRTANASNTLTLTPPSATAAYGLPRSFLTPRELQLAIKFDF